MMSGGRRLRPAQKVAARWLLMHSRGGLFLPMGFGKTFTLITVLAALAWPRTLVVAPKRVALDTWPSEMDETAPGVEYRVITGEMGVSRRLGALADRVAVTILSSSMLTWLTAPDTARAYKRLAGVRLAPFEAVVVDELSQYKSVSSRRTRALGSIVNNRAAPPRYVWGLTGTPIADHEEGLFSQMKLLDGGEALGTSVTRFRAEFLKPENPYASHSRLVIQSPAKGRELYERVAPRVVVQGRKELAELLPPVQYDDIKVRPGGRFMEYYASFAENAVTDVLGFEPKYDTAGRRVGMIAKLGPDAIGAVSAAALRNKLRQYTAGFLFREDGSVRWHDHSKIERTVELVDGLDGEPVLIFYGFVPEKEELMRRIPGAVVLDERFDMDAWNRRRVPVLLAHPASAGHGLNLQRGASHLLWQTVPESNELYQQANARLVRPGAEGTVWVHRLVMPGTVDEIVFADKGRKSGAEKRLLDHLEQMEKVALGRAAPRVA